MASTRRGFLRGVTGALTAASLRREVMRLRQMVDRQTPAQIPFLDRLRREPGLLMSATGLTPDPWQSKLLTSPSARTLLLCCRQSGKSTVSASLALEQGLLRPASLVLLLSPSLRQSGELFRKIVDTYRAIGRPLATTPDDLVLRMELSNGSRIIALPGAEETIRGFSGATLLIIDEASRVPDALYYSVRPMLAVSQGRLVCLSTPFGKRGWFFDEWHGAGSWGRVKITADQCPRITKEFLAEERLALGDRWFSQEYFCSFEETIGAVFRAEDVAAALADDVEPLFLKLG